MAQEKQVGKKEYVPVSVRLAFEEKAYLLERAGSRSLSSYMRSELLKDMGNTPRRQQRKKRHKPAIAERQMAHLLGIFMNSRIAGNINQMERQANSGSLNHADPEIKAQLLEAFEHVAAMRQALFTELGISFGEE